VCKNYKNTVLKINIILILVLFGLVVQYPLFELYGTYVGTFDVASISILVLFIQTMSVKYSKVMKIVVLIVLSGFFSIIMNLETLNSIPKAVFYAIRILEYSLWFYVGLRANIGLVKLLILIIFVKSVVSFYAGVYATPLDYLFFKYDHDIVATFLILSLYYLKNNNNGAMFLSLIASSLMSTRSAYFGIFYIIYYFIQRNTGAIVKNIPVISVFLIIIIATSMNEVLIDRLMLIFNYDNITAITLAYQESIQATSYHDFVYEDRNLFTEHGDLSFQLRLRKWMYYIGQLSENPMHIFYGFGVSAFGGAADSSLIRIFLEGGLIMFYFYWALVKQLVKYCYSGKEYVYLMIALSLMLDISFSSSVMPLAFFLIGTSRVCKK
jgi:hypothetical protein